jgi:hypothetical protein
MTPRLTCLCYNPHDRKGLVVFIDKDGKPQQPRYHTILERCFTCTGSKKVRGRTCPRCHGTGKVKRLEKVY